MSKKLILIRHAHSPEASAGEKDFDRNLSSQGIINSAQLGALMMKHNYRPDAIFSSDAVRAHATTQTFAGKINFDVNKVKWENQLYESSPRVMLQLANEFDEIWETVAIVGHNPVITYFAEYITGDMIGNMTPASMVVIELTVEEWSMLSGNTGKILTFLQPDTDRKDED